MAKPRRLNRWVSTRLLLVIATTAASLLAGCGNDNRILTFDEAFELVDAIPLDEEHLMYGASNPDLDDRGRFLIPDYQGKYVALFASDGTLIRTFDASECDPGAPFQPRMAIFLGADRFLAAGSYGTTYEFTIVEGCIGKVSSLHRNPRAWCLGSDDYVYVYDYDYPNERGRIVRFTPDLEPVDTLRLQQTTFPRLHGSYLLWNQITCAPDGSVYYVYPELAGAIDAQSGSHLPPLWPELYLPLTDEVEHSGAGSDGYMVGRKLSFAHSTSAMAVWALDGDRMITMFRREGEAMQDYSNLYYITGGGLNMVVESTGVHNWITFARDGYVYCRTVQGRPLPEDLHQYADAVNPVVLRYRLREDT